MARALVQERFCLGPFLLLQEAQTDLGQQAGQLGALSLGCNVLPSLGQLLLEQVGELGVLAHLSYTRRSMGRRPSRKRLEAFAA